MSQLDSSVLNLRMLRVIVALNCSMLQVMSWVLIQVMNILGSKLKGKSYWP